VPSRVFVDNEGRDCRVYERQVIIDGAPTTAFAIVCREASGRWVLSR
jgi:surface antigen